MKNYRVLIRISLIVMITILAFSYAELDAAKAGISNPNIFLPLVLKANLINFDDRVSPCLFANTTALRDEYQSLGVEFSGNQALNGGGILDQCSYFDVFGYSPPNFLAFNKTSHYSDGGVPTPPQIITFVEPASSVMFRAGSRLVGSSLTLSAYDGDDNKIAETSISLSQTLQVVTVNSPGIQYVVIDSTAEDFVIDDLSWMAE